MSLLRKQFSELYQRRELFMQMLWGEIFGRYKGAMLGFFWPFLAPLIMLLVYTFVFADVIGARWVAGGLNSKFDFALFVFCGLVIHNMLSDIMVKSPTQIRDNLNLVKKVVFPLEFLCFVVVLSTLFNFSISILILFVIIKAKLGMFYFTALYFPLVILPYVLLLASLSLALAAIGVFIKDVSYIAFYLSNAMLFLSPVFYSVETMPESFKKLALLNPLTLIIEQLRSVVIYGLAPRVDALLLYLIISVLIFICSYYIFVRARIHFADNI